MPFTRKLWLSECTATAVAKKEYTEIYVACTMIISSPSRFYTIEMQISSIISTIPSILSLKTNIYMRAILSCLPFIFNLTLHQFLQKLRNYGSIIAEYWKTNLVVSITRFLTRDIYDFFQLLHFISRNIW